MRKSLSRRGVLALVCVSVISPEFFSYSISSSIACLSLRLYFLVQMWAEPWFTFPQWSTGIVQGDCMHSLSVNILWIVCLTSLQSHWERPWHSQENISVLWMTLKLISQFLKPCYLSLFPVALWNYLAMDNSYRIEVCLAAWSEDL